MTWSLARMARYVQNIKYLQNLKDHEEFCNEAFEKGSYLLFCQNKPFLTRNQSGGPFPSKIGWRTFQELEPLKPNLKQSSIVLGVDNELDKKPLFACSVPAEKEQSVLDAFDGKFSGMRPAIFSLSDEEHQLVARGYCMITWDEAVKFCSYCGASLIRKVSGCSKECSQKCDPHKMTHYPQIHPVAITRVLNHTQDKILLVRKSMHPKGMYSCIAGFMEPGEVLDDNVRREVAEEAGIVVDKVQYFQSQAWALPQTTLMLACTAIALPGSEKIELDEEELEDARWFTKEEVRDALERVRKNPNIMRENNTGELFIPPHGAIAHSLIRNWLEGYIPSQL